MNITPAPYCKLCHFYHGSNGVVCSLHPDGPDSETCRDYTPNASDRIQGQTSRDGWNIRSSHDYKAWQKILMLGLLVGSFSAGCLLGWLVATHSTQPTSKTNTQLKQRY